MQPSAFYADEEKTYAGGFVYKVTTSSVDSLYSLNDEIDESIAYTTPKGNSHFDYMCMGGWNNNSEAAYVDKQLWFNKDYGSNGHCNVNMLTIDKHSFSDYGNTTVCFMSSPAGYYLFGTGAEATSTKGSMSSKLITDFEVNKIVFGLGLLTGWTKADFEDFIENGSLADNDGYNISFSDFMSDPSGYYIRTFDPVARGYWDGSTWKANNLTDSPNIKPVFMTNNPKTKGFLALNKHNFDSAQGTGAYGVHNINCYNSSSTNATNISAYQIGSMYSELNKQGFILAETPGTLIINPDLTGHEMMDLTGDGVTGADTTLPATDIIFADGIRTLKYDQYTLTADSGSSGPSHFSRYYYYFCHGMYGEYLYKLFAYMGVYFYTGTLAELNASGATPDNMAVTGMKLGEMDADGNTTGNWIGPDAMPSYQGINKGGSIVHPGYNPTPSPPTPSEDDYTDMDLGVSNITLGGLTKYAILSKSELIGLIADYNGNASMAGSNFSNHIICLYRLGFPATAIATTKTGNIVMVRSAGDVDFTSQANTYKLITRQTSFISAGSITVPRMTNTFYDFSPYTSYELYIPGCGWIPLPDNVAGRVLKVYIVFDLPTCSAKGIVRIAGGIYGGTTIATVNGIIGASCPFTIGENGQQRAAVMSANAQVAAGIATGIVGATVNPMMAVAGGAELLSGLIGAYTAGNTNYVSTKGGAADFSMFGDGGRAVLKINSPVVDSVVNNSEFGHTVGYMCNETGQLSNFHGFTVCSNPHINISASSRERDEIKQLLEQGVILP